MIDMKKKVLKIAAWVVVVTTMMACSSVAFTGRNRLLLYSDSEIAALSDQSYNEMMQTTALSSDAARTAMVKEVGQRLSVALSQYLSSKGQSSVLDNINWQFSLVKDEQVNAFCMPDGKVVFYEGIMPLLDTPDLVAVVMGHEMGHAVARHGNERMTQQALVSLVGSVTGEVVEQKTSETGRALFEAAFAIGSEYGILLPYSRKHEYEADEIGLYIMAIAGYDIAQAPLLWKKMSESGGQAIPEFMSTHPSDEKRIKNLEKLQGKAAKYVTTK